MAIQPGYMGWAVILGTGIPFTDANIAAKQGANLPDIISGTQLRKVGNWAPVDISGSISGPVIVGASIFTYNAADFDATCGGYPDGEISIAYTCGGNGITFDGGINSVNMSVSAGDQANYSVDVIGKGAPTAGGTGSKATGNAIVMWDQCVVTFAGGGAEIQSANVTLGWNITPIYVVGGGDLFPYELLGGQLTLSGSVTYYGSFIGGGSAASDVFPGTGNVEFNFGGNTITAGCAIHRAEPTAQTGPVTTTVNFSGPTE